MTFLVAGAYFPLDAKIALPAALVLVGLVLIAMRSQLSGQGRPKSPALSSHRGLQGTPLFSARWLLVAGLLLCLAGLAAVVFYLPAI